MTCCWISHIWLSRPALPGTGAGAQEDRQRQPRSSVCSDCAQLFPMMSVDWGMCSLVVATRAGFSRVRFRVEQARRPCELPQVGAHESTMQIRRIELAFREDLRPHTPCARCVPPRAPPLLARCAFER